MLIKQVKATKNRIALKKQQNIKIRVQLQLELENTSKLKGRYSPSQVSQKNDSSLLEFDNKPNMAFGTS